jgi:phage tail P2-like protein
VTAVLPPNSTAFEEALKVAAFLAIEVPVPVDTLWSAERIPAALLPFLAWALSVDDWDPEWTDETKRAVVSASIDVHRRKGTVWAMRRALVAAGLGDADIQEGWSASQFDGSFTFDGSRNHQSSDHWAEYRVTLPRPMSIPQAARARAILTTAAPARCHLKEMSFEHVANLYNGAIDFDGLHTHGVV